MCFKDTNVLNPKELKSKFNMAMKKCVKTRSASHHVPPFSLSQYYIHEKDKVPCMHLLYRGSTTDDPFKDLLIFLDFVIGLQHPRYKTEHDLPLANGKEGEGCTFYVIPKVSERKSINSQNAFFLVSYSDLESRFVNGLPDRIRTGFILPKLQEMLSFAAFPRI